MTLDEAIKIALYEIEFNNDLKTLDKDNIIAVDTINTALKLLIGVACKQLKSDGREKIDDTAREIKKNVSQA